MLLVAPFGESAIWIFKLIAGNLISGLDYVQWPNSKRGW